MWVAVSLEGVCLKTFGAAGDSWKRAVRWAEREGGNLEILWSLSAVVGEQVL
jgi:hypothetical protein